MTSRNSAYEQKMRDKGLKKITLWIPEHCSDDLKLMASICCDNQDFIPSTVRSLANNHIPPIISRINKNYFFSTNYATKNALIALNFILQACSLIL
jgi:hypothetical protein